MLGLIGVAVLWLSFLNRRSWLWCVAGAYALGVILTAGYTPGRSYEMNWDLAGIVVVVALLVLGIRFRNPYLCFAAVVIAAIGLAKTPVFKVMMNAIHFAPKNIGPEDILSTAVITALGVLLWVRTRNVVPIVPLCAPLGWRGGILAWNMSEWGYVLLGFLILAAGAWVSIRKGRKNLSAPSENREPGK